MSVVSALATSTSPSGSRAARGSTSDCLPSGVTRVPGESAPSTDRGRGERPVVPAAYPADVAAVGHGEGLEVAGGGHLDPHTVADLAHDLAAHPLQRQMMPPRLLHEFDCTDPVAQARKWAGARVRGVPLQSAAARSSHLSGPQVEWAVPRSRRPQLTPERGRRWNEGCRRHILRAAACNHGLAAAPSAPWAAG